MSSTYKVWLHIEEINEDGEGSEPEQPRLIHCCDSLREAVSFADDIGALTETLWRRPIDERPGA